MTIGFIISQAEVTYRVGDIDPQNKAFALSNNFVIPFEYQNDSRQISVFLRELEGQEVRLVFGNDFLVKNGTIIEQRAGVFGHVEIRRSHFRLRSITIYRNVRKEQATSLTERLVFSTTTENALDKLTMLVQDRQFRKYAVSASDKEMGTEANLTLPKAADRANKYLGFGDYGEVVCHDRGPGSSGALKQPDSEEIDISFVISREMRSNSALSFDLEGSVFFVGSTLNSLIKAGNHIRIDDEDLLRIVSTTYEPGSGIIIDKDTGIISHYLTAHPNNTVVMTDGIIRGNYVGGFNILIDGNVINQTDTPELEYHMLNFTLSKDGWDFVSGEYHQRIFLEEFEFSIDGIMDCILPEKYQDRIFCV